MKRKVTSTKFPRPSVAFARNLDTLQHSVGRQKPKAKGKERGIRERGKVRTEEEEEERAKARVDLKVGVTPVEATTMRVTARRKVRVITSRCSLCAPSPKFPYAIGMRNSVMRSKTTHERWVT